MNIQLEKTNGVAVVRLLAPHLAADNIQLFKQQVMPIIEENPAVVIDMEEVTFVDSSGLGALLSCLRQLTSNGGTLRICCVNESVRKLFELVRMHRVFDIMTDRDAALKSIAE